MRLSTTFMDDTEQLSNSGVTIVLADDHAIVRSALRTVLEEEGGFTVVAEAGDIGAAVRKVSAYKPAVLVLDLNMPGGSSLDAIPRLRQMSPRTAIVVVTIDDSLPSARAALRAGAHGFVLKEAADTELVDAVQAAARGHRYLDPHLGARAAAEPEGVARPDNLSARECEVLGLIARGYTNTEIADQLGLSVRTVESHRSHLQHKTEIATRAELFSYAREHHIVD
ncbi:MAG TPA: response regulator transcription factor [Solirubrobacteraceae bacterium]|nr:response regulator transcription factor [Solirubrobacteraceae bacterium]